MLVQVCRGATSLFLTLTRGDRCEPKRVQASRWLTVVCFRVTKRVITRSVMARTIQMPSEDELPEGPRRDFVIALRRYYRSAGRPPLRQISRMIEGREDLKEVTASQETVRRMLRGTVIPVDWNRVNAVFQVLCEGAEIDPDGHINDGFSSFARPSLREQIRDLWDRALEEEPEAPPLLRPAAPTNEQTSSHSGFSDEPPF